MKNSVGFALSLAMVAFPAIVIWTEVIARARDGSILVNPTLFALGTLLFVVGFAGALMAAVRCKCEE